MLRVIKEVQLFLLANPDEYIALTEPKFISYALIQITKTGGMYAKGIEKCQKRTPQDRIKWAELLDHMVKDYEQQLTETGLTTLGQKGYGAAIHAAEDLTDGESLTKAVTKYTRIATQA